MLQSPLLFEAAHSELECGEVTDWNRWAGAALDVRKPSLLSRINAARVLGG